MNGDDIFLDHYRDFNADIYVTATDIWIFQNSKLLNAAREGQCLWLPFCFVDYEPTRFDAQILSSALRVVPTSRWLRNRLRELKLETVSEPIFLGCVDAETLVLLANGSWVTIKDIVESTKNYEVLGFRENKFVQSKVLAIQKIRFPKTLSITTTSGRLLKITEDNPLLVKRDGLVSWSLARDLQLGDMVYTIGDMVYTIMGEPEKFLSNYSRTSFGEQNGRRQEMDRSRENNIQRKVPDDQLRRITENISQNNNSSQAIREETWAPSLDDKYLQTSNRIFSASNRSRNWLHRWNYRRRGVHHNYKGSSTQTFNRLRVPTKGRDNQRGREYGRVPSEEDTFYAKNGIPSNKFQEEFFNLQTQFGRVQSPSILGNDERRFKGEERSSRIGDQILQVKVNETLQSTIQSRREEHPRQCHSFECHQKWKTSWETVTKISQSAPSDGFVYDLTTETGNFFANGILIHNCDHEIFKPWIGETDSEGKEITKGRLKASLGFPEDSYLILIVAINQLFRKCFGEWFHAIQIFRENNPDVNVKVFLHSLPRVLDGFSLPELALEYGLDYQRGDVTFADQYTMLKGVLGYNENRMAKLYNASDVLLDATSGASPGMPVLEAQSAGIPVIGTDYTTYPEFIHAGYCAKVLKYFHSPSVPWIKKALPDPYSIADCLEKILNSDPNRWMKIGPESMKEYTWENTLQGWLHLLENIELEIETKCLRIPTPSETLQKKADEVMILTSVG